eukprot:2584387-Prymnesium_polylepis.1
MKKKQECLGAPTSPWRAGRCGWPSCEGASCVLALAAGTRVRPSSRLSGRERENADHLLCTTLPSRLPQAVAATSCCTDASNASASPTPRAAHSCWMSACICKTVCSC